MCMKEQGLVNNDGEGARKKVLWNTFKENI